MKIENIDIKNYRSLHNVSLYSKDILALVGRNNSGKSNILKALQLFFDGSTKLIDKECFHGHQTDNPIEIFVTFGNLSEWEKEQFNYWLDGDKLTVGRRIICTGEDSYTVDNIAIKSMPEPEWLQEEKITGEKINEWWDKKESLVLNELDFLSGLGSQKPTVKNWKEVARNFVEINFDKIPMVSMTLENPRGYPGVLKGALPEFVHIPAVRDVMEEAKVGKTNPFGRLINSILDKISQEKKDIISKKLKEVEELLNRGDAGERIDEIKEIESRLTNLMCEIMDCDIEIEMSTPQLKEVFGGAKIYADDGTRTTIETKGHGLQRSMIFSIFRAYAELTHSQKAGERAAQRSTIFAIEEPELYMHPQSQRTLMSIFRDIANGNDQIIYSTQSSLFVDISYFDEICIIRREKDDTGYKSHAKQLPISSLKDDIKARKGIDATEIGIREQYSHVFNPMINEGFFADKVIIVEGPSELYILPIYAACLDCNFDRNNISIVHADGKGQMDRLLRIFNGFKIPTFLWFDGDKDNTDNAATRKTLELLTLLGQSKDKIEDVETEIADDYCVLEYNLERTLKTELDNYDELVREAKANLGPVGKPLANRYVASRLKERVDNGESVKEVLPKTIIEIVDRITKLSYRTNILKNHPHQRQD